MIIKYGNTDITELLLEYKRKGSIDQDNIFLLGNTPSYELDLKLDNSTHILETLSGYIQEYDDESILKGTYLIYEAPKKYTDIVDLICFDLMLLTNIPYNSQLQYPTTVRNQLNEMSALTTVSITTTNIPQEVLSQEVNFWDNTISCRDYIGWIAEISGTNASCNTKGEIIFKQLSKTFDYQTSDVENYSIDELFTISRICFDNGLLKLEQGTTDGNTLYLSSNNPYIDNEHDPIDRIFKLYNGWTVTSLEKMKAAALDSVKLLDVVAFNNYKFICLDIDSVYHGGEFQVQELKGKLTTKNAEKTEIKYDKDVKIKKLSTTIDQNSQELSILAKNQDGLRNDQAEIKLNVNTIAAEVSKAYKQEDADILEQKVTKLSQDAESFQFDFTRKLESIDKEQKDNYQEFLKYIRFEDGDIILGNAQNELKLVLQNDRIVFFQSNKEIAYFRNNKLYVLDGEFTKSLIIGNFSFVPRANGSLDFKKIK